MGNHKTPKRKHILVCSLISLRYIFLDLSPQTRKTKAKISKSDYIKVKTSAQQKQTINSREIQPKKWQNIFANHIFDSG